MGKTLEIDEEAFAHAERIAGATQRTVSQVVEDALREMIARRQTLAHQNPFVLHTISGKLNPDVNFDSNVAIQDFLDECDGPARR